MRARTERFESLTSPAFIAALALLVVNDFALKPLFHNALTGKLSDFAGLFAVTLFAVAAWPQHRHMAGSLIAAAFVFWNTGYADPLVAWLNALSPFTVGRTVDLTDVVALPMVPFALWAEPRLRVWPLPRALKVGLAVLAPIAFAATTRVPYVVRSTTEVTAAALVDETEIQNLIDDVAGRHGLRCQVCDPIEQGRVYLQRSKGPESLTVNFDAARSAVFFSTTGWSRDGRRGVLALAADIRAALSERFPGAVAVVFEEAHDWPAPLETTLFTISAPSGDELAVDVAEGAKRTLSAIVEDVVRAHGLRADAGSLIYYAGRRVGVSAAERDFVLSPTVESNATLRVGITRHSASFEALQRAVAQDLEGRLNAAFGPANVRREGHSR